jgi:hypothetical protein
VMIQDFTGQVNAIDMHDRFGLSGPREWKKADE